jgi:pyridinium-3,5-bisthiocarboxylic acid mononucleotide nickel chelatase
MNIAYFDCQFGAAGDMLVGSLIGAGLRLEDLQRELDKLAIPSDSYKAVVEDTDRCHLQCKKFTVMMPNEHPHTEHRHLSDILTIIDHSKISAAAKALSSKIFTQLAKAEAHVHGIPLDEVHFHEVGAIDAIVDIVGFAIGYDILKIEKSFVSPLPLGSGSIKTEHGLFPIPGPATVQLLADAGAPTSSATFNHECLTPTGAAILTTIADSYGLPPAMEKITSIGYGAGTFNPTEFPNVCRVVIGTAQNMKNSWRKETIAVLETNLDDLSPQIISYCTEQLFSNGALDVIIAPATMKKGRSGHLLQVLCHPSDQTRLEEVIFSQTSALGIRSYLCQRSVADRKWQDVQMSQGDTVKVKVGYDLSGNIFNVQPEFEDCAAYASKHNLPLKSVIQEAISKLRN